MKGAAKFVLCHFGFFFFFILENPRILHCFDFVTIQQIGCERKKYINCWLVVLSVCCWTQCLYVPTANTQMISRLLVNISIYGIPEKMKIPQYWGDIFKIRYSVCYCNMKQRNAAGANWRNGYQKDTCTNIIRFTITQNSRNVCGCPNT